MKKSFFVALITILIELPNIIYAQREQDSLALVALYNSTGGPNWINNTNWLTPNPISTWNGVTVENGRVTELNFGNNNLNGVLPSEIGNLSELRKLSIYATPLQGSVPPEIGNLKKLTYLGLNQNGITSIPREIGNLTNLTVLGFCTCQLSGSLPEEINDLINLKYLDVSINKLSGCPALNLNNIEILNLNNNQLTFEDLEPNFGIAKNSFGYIPQESTIGSTIDTIGVEGRSFTFSVPCGGLSTQYLWYHDNVQVYSTTGNNYFTIASLSISDAGSYKCVMTNSKVPGLTYNSRAINLTVMEEGRVLDSLSLVALYNSTNGPNWNNKTNWLSSEPISKWYGVTVENDRVAKIKFFLNELRGNLPKEIGNLTELTRLEINANPLGGAIPNEIGNLKKLAVLDFSQNILTSIPTEIGGLTNLTHLGLTVNQLSGAVPVEINNLTNLNFLSLGYNSLSEFPPLTLSQLNSLDLSDNNFTFEDIEPNINVPKVSFGYSPQDSIGIKIYASRNIGETYTFNVSCGGVHNLYQWKKNNVDIPTAINSTYTISSLNYSDAGSYTCAMTNTVVPGLTINSRPINLTIVDKGREQDSLALVAMYNSTGGPNWTNKTNWLSSLPIASWFGITLSNNRVSNISLPNNNLSGVIPPEIGNLTNLSFLLLADNKLSGSIPAQIGGLNNLEYLFLNCNKLSGSIPPDIGNLTNLLQISCYGNELSGILPPQIGNLSKLNFLCLNYNQLNGSIPPQIGNLKELTNLSIVLNKLTGPIPHEIGNLTNLTYLGLGNNLLSGSIPVEICNLTKLTWLDLSGNSLTGTIPNEIGNLTNLLGLGLGQNQLTGTIPKQIGNLTNLTGLYLGSNQLSGAIPSEICNLIKLGNLDLGQNKLTGSIPEQIGNLTNLGEIILFRNQLTGPIPSSIGKLINLFAIRLFDNQLSGEIPSQIGNMVNLTNVLFNDNHLEGTIPLQIGNLSKLQELALYNNKLTGQIPKEIGNIVSLEYLRLFNNDLNGSVPMEINKLTNLLQLGLSGNSLDGLPKLTMSILDFLLVEANHFTFEDLEPNINLAKRQFSYSPQDSIGQEQYLTARAGTSIRLSINCGGENNLYQWKKNNIPLPGENKPYLRKLKLQPSDAGSYVCDVTNTVVTGLTISSRPIHLSVTNNGRTKDSLALVMIYNSTGGTNWLHNTNWLSSEPIDTWYGVTVGLNSSTKGLSDSTSVLRLNLSGNNLTGIIPPEIGTMTGLQSLDLSSNMLTGAVPAEINSIPSIQALNLSDNRLDSLPVLLFMSLDTLELGKNQFSFVDLAPNVNVSGKVLDYLIQDSIGVKKDTICFSGASMIFNAEDNALYNSFQWYKDGVLISSATNSTYSLSNLSESNAGKYHCSITNPTVPNLTLFTRPTKLIISTPTVIKGNDLSGIRIYPNPTHGKITIEMGNGVQSEGELSVSNYYGKVVYQKQVDARTLDVDLSNMTKGLYILRFTSKGEIFYRKVVIH